MKIGTLADLPDESVLSGSSVAVDDVDLLYEPLVRCIFRGGLELMDPLDTTWILEELLWELIDEFSERSLAE